MEIGVGALEDDYVEVRALLDQAPSSASSTTVAAVTVLIGGCSKVTR
jgi:hypothetical protein